MDSICSVRLALNVLMFFTPPPPAVTERNVRNGLCGVDDVPTAISQLQKPLWHELVVDLAFFMSVLTFLHAASYELHSLIGGRRRRHL
jgi:hypothetical protein